MAGQFLRYGRRSEHMDISIRTALPTSVCVPDAPWASQGLNRQGYALGLGHTRRVSHRHERRLHTRDSSWRGSQRVRPALSSHGRHAPRNSRERDTACGWGLGPTLCQGGTILMSLKSYIYSCKVFGPYPEARGMPVAGSVPAGTLLRHGQSRTSLGEPCGSRSRTGSTVTTKLYIAS